jgi:serine/threonine protein kinase
MAQATPDDNMTITPAEDTISAPYFDDAFTRSDTSIGSGSFGSVYECTPTQVGLAYLRDQGLVGDTVPRLVVKSPKDIHTGDSRERENLSTWKHKGIVQFFGEFPDRSNGVRHLVLEAMNGVGDGDVKISDVDKKASSPGDFWRYIATREALTDGEFRMIAFQLLSAIEYLHHYNVVHRDLKTENMLCGEPILANPKLGTAPTVKLSDFGTARALTVVDQYGLRRQGTTLAIGIDGTKRWTGTAQFIAPELLKLGAAAGVLADELLDAKAAHSPNEKFPREIHFMAVYDTKCDIYSLGVTFFSMLLKKLPYGNENDPW